VITISATINRRRGDPDLNRDTARRGGVDRTLARDRAIGDLDDVDLDDVDLDDVAAGLACDLLLAGWRRRASDSVWVRAFAATPWVRVTDFTAWPR
jgi:hypothetical protein